MVCGTIECADVVVTLEIGEISQVRRRSILLGGHEKTVRAQEIVFLADEDLRVVLGAADFGLFRPWMGVANVFLVDGPGPRQRLVDDALQAIKKQRAWRAKRAEPGSLCDSRKIALVPAYGPRTLLAVHVSRGPIVERTTCPPLNRSLADMMFSAAAPSGQRTQSRPGNR